jgi:hypothetical protein
LALAAFCIHGAKAREVWWLDWLSVSLPAAGRLKLMEIKF